MILISIGHKKKFVDLIKAEKKYTFKFIILTKTPMSRHKLC